MFSNDELHIILKRRNLEICKHPSFLGSTRLGTRAAGDAHAKLSGLIVNNIIQLNALMEAFSKAPRLDIDIKKMHIFSSFK